MTPRRKQAQAMLRITQVRSRIGNQERIVRVLTDGLGLGRIGSCVELPDTPATRGMIAKVSHMVRVEELGARPAGKGAKEATPSATSAGGDTPGEAAGDESNGKRERRASSTAGAAASEE